MHIQQIKQIYVALIKELGSKVQPHFFDRLDMSSRFVLVKKDLFACYNMMIFAPQCYFVMHLIHC
jgi:hypothetical protein